MKGVPEKSRYSRVVRGMFVVLVSDLSQMLGIGAVLLEVFLSSVSEHLGCDRAAIDPGDVSHHFDVLVHWVRPVVKLKLRKMNLGSSINELRGSGGSTWEVTPPSVRFSIM